MPVVSSGALLTHGIAAGRLPADGTAGNPERFASEPESAVKILFWLLAVPTVAIAILVLLLPLAGRPLSAATPIWLSALAALAVLAMVAWARRLAAAGRPGRAGLLVVGSWFLFAIVMIGNGLARLQSWN